MILEILLVKMLHRYYLYALADPLFIYLFLEKHIDVIQALLHYVRDDNLASVMLSNFDAIGRDRFKSLFLVVALRSVNKHFWCCYRGR